MWSARVLCLLALVSLAAPLPAAASPAAAPTLARHRRQTLDQANIIDLQAGGAGAGEDEGEERTREKRKLEGVTQAKFGIKNAVLGFVFGSGSTWSRPRPKSSPTRITRGSSASSLEPSVTAAAREPRQVATYPDGVPMFDRNKVSLDFPGSLFGPSVSLVIRATKIVGDVIQNSAERYRTFLRLFRPLFRGPFEIKGLDPPPTTTTTTSTTTTTTTTTELPTTTPTTTAPSSDNTPSQGDNEVRRRKRKRLHID